MTGRSVACDLVFVAVSCAATTSNSTTPAVVLQADVSAARCVEGRVRSSQPAVRVQARAVVMPGEADVVVGPDATLGRALEAGDLVERTAVELGDVPWVLVSRSGPPPPFADLERLQPEIWVLGGATGEAARKALQHVPPARVHSTRDPAVLAAAPLALMPASLAGGGEVGPTPVAPLRMRAVLTRRATGSTAAAEALRALDHSRLRECLGAR